MRATLGLKPMSSQENRTSLADTAIQRLKNRPVWLTLSQIGKETGIPKAWLSYLQSRKSKNPQVTRLETLISYLDEKGIQ